MSKVDWSKAPEGAEWHADCNFYRGSDGDIWYFCSHDERWKLSMYEVKARFTLSSDYEPRPQQWPDESRIDIIGTNGNTGEAYVHYDEFREKCATGPSVYASTPKGNPSATSPKSNYERLIVGLDGTKTTVDVYRVLDAFNVDSHAIAHSIKKLLAPGLRHSKDRKQDLQEAIDSIAAELLLMEQKR